MRLLIIPMIASRQTVPTESNFLVFRDLLSKVPPDWFANVVLFENVTGVTARPNETYFFVDKFSSLYDQQVILPDAIVDLFHPVDGKYPVDMILTSRSVLAGFMRRLFWNRLVKKPLLPICIIEPKAVDESDTHNQVCEEELFLRSVGYANSFTFFSTVKEWNTGLSLCRRFLSSSMVSRVKENSTVIPLGINCDEIDKFKGEFKHNKFTLCFAGRVNTNKNPRWILDVFKKYWQSGKDVSLIRIVPMDDSDLGVDYPMVKPYTRLPRSDYLRILCSANLILNNSHVEGFSVGLTEQFYAGPIVLVPRKDWVRAWLKDQFENYPFLFDGETEAYSKIKWVHENYEEAQRLMEPFRQWCRREYDLKGVVTREVGAVEDYMKRVSPNLSVTIADDVKVLLNKCVDKMPDMFRFSDYCDAVLAEARIPALVFRRYNMGGVFPAKLAVYKYLRDDLRLVDALDDPDPMFLKEVGNARR